MSGPNDREPPGGAEAANKILACAERTLAAGSARIELHSQLRVPQVDQPRRAVRRSTWLRIARGLAKLLFRALWKRIGQGREPGHFAAEGFIEPVRGRYMLDYGSYAMAFIDGRLHSGRSGRPLQTFHPAGGNADQVFWLLRLLPGVTDASPEGTDTLHGTACQKLTAHVDMARASAASGDGLRPPTVDRYEKLHALPVTVWIDAEHIRRIEFEAQHPGSQHLRLDLWEFGVPVDELDWSRLPAFRSPGDADR